MGRELRFTVPPSQAGCPLGAFLRGQGVSAALIKAVKYRGSGFWADGRPVYTDHRLRGGAVITFALPPEKTAGVKPQDIPLVIAYEDEEALLLDKPAGLAVHPTLTIPDGTLANGWAGLMQRRGEPGVFRPLNRLDKNTSGLVLCAKDAYAAPLLAARCQKRYWAIVGGEMPLGPGQVEAPIGRAEESILARRVCPGGKPSLTLYRVLAAGGGYSLLEVTPRTGRTHQIRVHMAWLGHPLAGDSLYGGEAALPRHALHCGQIWFEGSLGPKEAQSPLPPDMLALAQGAGLL